MTIAAGSRLGPYEVMGLLGAGGMGEVYRARDTRLERTVAVKVLPTHLSESPEIRERFDREAKTISQLSHPNICTLYDVGHQDGIDYLVMEYLEGETLSERLRKGPLPIEQVLRYGVEIAGAPGPGAPAGHRPPRPEAGKRHADPHGRQAARLRPRQGFPGAAVVGASPRSPRRRT